MRGGKAVGGRERRKIREGEGRKLTEGVKRGR